VTDATTDQQCENCGHSVPVIEIERVVEIEKIVEVKKELTLAERTAIIDASVEGELERFFLDRAPDLLLVSDSAVTVAMRELDRRLPRITAASHLTDEARDAKMGKRRKRRRDQFDG